MGGCGSKCMLDGVHLLVFVCMCLCACACVYAFPSHEHCLKYSSFHMTHICVYVCICMCLCACACVCTEPETATGHRTMSGQFLVLGGHFEM